MINIVQVGIGPLGQKIIRFAVERGCFNLRVAYSDLYALKETQYIGIFSRKLRSHHNRQSLHKSVKLIVVFTILASALKHSLLGQGLFF
jgi:hypothetical protein